MLSYPIRKLVAAGIEEILVVTGTEHMGDVVGFLGSGRDFGCAFTYRVQDKAGGIAEALGLARGFAGGDRICVVLGDNIFEDDLIHCVERFREQNRGARLLLKQVDDPSRFGVAEIRGDHIVGIEEKPAKPRSDLCVTGVYMYDEQVFEIIAGLRPSERGELEITDVNSVYLERGELEFDRLQGWWTDAGTFESLARAQELVRQWKEIKGL